jgi:hypothetical protein
MEQKLERVLGLRLQKLIEIEMEALGYDRDQIAEAKKLYTS